MHKNCKILTSMKFCGFLAVLSLLMTASPSAHAIDVGLVGGLSLANQSVSTTYSVNVESKSGMAIGVLGNAKFIGAPYGLTTGLLFVEMGAHLKSVNGIDQRNYDVTVPYLQIPVIFDFWVIDTLLVGAGGYVAFPGGNIKTAGTQTFFVTTPLNISQTFAAANYREFDWGAIVHAQLKVPVMGQWFATASLLYEFGLEDVNTLTDATTRNNTFLTLVGFGLEF